MTETMTESPPVSRQRLLQRKWAAEGRCRICGQPQAAGGRGAVCERHRQADRDKARDNYRRKHGIPLDAPLRKAGRPRLDG